MKTLLFTTIIFSYCLLTPISLPQDNNLKQNFNSNNKIKTQTLIFNDIETGIMTNDVKKISKHFSPQPYISLINGVNGYYSSNQAYYIIQDFLNSYQAISLKIAESKGDELTSYGKGDYYFERKGKREAARLYLTLSKSGSKWQITQISIN